MNSKKQVPKLHFDRIDLAEREADVSTYKVKSSSKASNDFKEDNIPNLCEFIFGDSDAENNSSKRNQQTSSRRECFITNIQILEGQIEKIQPYKLGKVEDTSLDMDPNELFENFENIFNVRFLSNEEHIKMNSDQQRQHLKRDLRPEFACEQVKSRANKRPIKLKKRSDCLPQILSSKSPNIKVRNDKHKILDRNLNIPCGKHMLKENSVGKSLKKENEEISLLKEKLALKNEGRSIEISRESILSENVIKVIPPNECYRNDLCSVNKVKEKSRGNSKGPNNFSFSKINEGEKIKENSLEDCKVESDANQTRQILKDITNYNHKDFKPYFHFDHSKLNETKKPIVPQFKKNDVFQRGSFNPIDKVKNKPAKEAQTERPSHEILKKVKNIAVKNIEIDLEAPKNLEASNQELIRFKRRGSETERLGHQHLQNIKMREHKVVGLKARPLVMKAKEKNQNNVNQQIPDQKNQNQIPKQKNDVRLTYAKLLKEIWCKDEDKAISLPKRAY